jgi:SAM-dependent methyltransferase
VARAALDRLPGPIARHLPEGLRRRRRPRLGRVDLGDLTSTAPVSGDFGWRRGLPVDRHYVEQFLERHRADIRGRVLEVGDAAYSERFGGAAITRQDVLHVHADNPAATIVGDLSRPDVLPDGAFDCIVLTQTLHLVYDLRAAAAALHRALVPGGVLLLTVPGISQVDRGEWGADWFWSMTPAAVGRLLGDAFGSREVEVAGHGNVYAATTFLQGLALSEVDTRKLDVVDDAYPVIVTARAVRR